MLIACLFLIYKRQNARMLTLVSHPPLPARRRESVSMTSGTSLLRTGQRNYKLKRLAPLEDFTNETLNRAAQILWTSILVSGTGNHPKGLRFN